MQNSYLQGGSSAFVNMKKIKLNGKSGVNKFALVDDEDYEKVNEYDWRLKENGYISINSSTSIYLHRFIMNVKKGDYVDHINHNKLDNRRNNLRICTNKQNNWNKNYNRTVGVSKTSNGKKWRAYITINHKQKWLGSFLNKIDALSAYNEAVVKYRDIYSFKNMV